jgi:plasmid stabilization system protein ParE
MLIWSEAALADMVRLRRFLEDNDNPQAARRVAEAIKKGAGILLDHPGYGKRLEGRQDRELVIPFGKRGYVMRYRLDGDDIVILKIWHTREERGQG